MLAITDRRSTTPEWLRLSQPTASAMLLRAVNLIRWRQLDDEWVVFLPGNGLLTSLDSFNATVLDSLERGAQSAEAVALMLGRDAERPAGFENIEALPQRFVVMSTDVVKMKGFIAEHTGL